MAETKKKKCLKFYHFAIGRGRNLLQYKGNSANISSENYGKMKLSAESIF